MPVHMYQNLHEEAEFIALASRSNMKSLIEEYRGLGLTFCYFQGGSFDPSTGYNRDFVDQPGLREGIVYIRKDQLQDFDLSQEEGFVIQMIHELGHYEAFRRNLDQSESLAWDLAEDIARSIYGDSLPDWWIRTRCEVEAKAQERWARDRKNMGLT